MVTRNNSPLQVVHLSTSHTGGAGIAARRLNQELNSHNFSSVFYSLSREDYAPSSGEYAIARSLIARVKSLPALLLARYLTRFSFFSLISSSAVSNSWLKSLVSNGTTILHIHNWFNLLSQRQLISLVKSGAPIVFTMHDQRLLTGGCHYAFNCERFYSGCHSCPITPILLSSIPVRNSKNLLSVLRTGSTKVKFIAPSMYLVDEAQKSSILKQIKVSHVPNVLPTDYGIGIPLQRSLQPADPFIVGIASMNPFDFIKGGDIVEELISSQSPTFHNISFLKLSDFPPDRHSDFWSSINCLLVPSRADNSPNVIHEAKRFRVPVIASDVGGIPELLSSFADVIIPIANLSSKTLLEAILLTQQRNISREDLARSFEEFKEYTDGSIERMIEIYSQSFRGE